MRNAAALLLSLALTVPALARETVRAHKLRDATLLELAARPAPPQMPRENRHTERRRTGPTAKSRGRVEVFGQTARLVGVTPIAPPPVALAFPSDTSRLYSPADASGAAGRQHVVSASNMNITVHQRGGEPIVQLRLNQFWEGGGTNSEIYDPRLLYDIAADRWVTIAIRDEQAILVAVSATSNPYGAWHRYEIQANGCDFTRLALTRGTVLVSTIMPSGNGALFSIAKEQFYAGLPTLPVVTHTVQGEAAPVHAPDSDAEYIAEAEDGALLVRRMDVAQAPNRRFEAGFKWNYDLPTAPQPGTGNRLDLGYADVETAVLHDGFVYAVHRAGHGSRTPDGNGLIWWKVDPEGNGAPEIGIIDGPELYAYPSLAVNRRGGMLIAYCVFSANRYPSSAYIYRDPTGRVSTSGEIRTGNSAVVHTDRWGDYTAVVVDPLNQRDFWVAQIATDQGVWQTWWAHIPAPESKRRAVRR